MIRAFLWSNFHKYSNLTRVLGPQKVAKEGTSRNLGWWNIVIWPDFWKNLRFFQDEEILSFCADILSYVHLYIDALGWRDPFPVLVANESL